MDEIYWTAQQVQWFYSISAPTLGEWVKNGFPKSGRNKYPARTGYEWVKKNILHAEGILGDINEEKLLRERAKRIQDEIKAKQMAGDLIPKSQSIFWLTGIVAEAKLAFQGLPKRLAPILRLKNDEKDIELELRLEIYRIIKDLARPLNAKHRSHKKRHSK